MTDKASKVKEAQKYLARGQLDKAIAEWEKLTKEYPDGSTFNTIGDLYLKNGDKANAVNSYHHAADYFRREGFVLKAFALYKKILNIDPNDDRALLELGELNEAKGLITDAMQFYRAAAESISKTGNRERRRAVYEKILAISPADIPLRAGLAELHMQDGAISEAVRHYFRIAQIKAESEDTDGAIEYYRKILALEKENRQALLELIAVYELAGSMEKALEQATEAIYLLPRDAEILMRAAGIEWTLGKFDEAKERLNRVTDLEPANLRARKMLAELYLKEGNRQKAWQEYLAVLDEVLLEENQGEALTLLESFKDIDPVETGKRLITLFMHSGRKQQLVQQLQDLGDIFMQNGKRREALNYYREAIGFAPDDGVLKNTVNELEQELGDESVSIDAERKPAEAAVDANSFILQERDIDEDEIFEKPESVSTEETGMENKLILPDQMDADSKKSPAGKVAGEEKQESDAAGSEIRDAGEIPVPPHDGNVMDIFDEFKKGLEKEIAAEDYETHYNLGIAYREMGLLDDAIREFQVSRNDPGKFIHSSIMLGACYEEKGLYPLAIDILKSSLAMMKEKDEPYWIMQYGLAEAYEKNNNMAEALDAYLKVFGWNSQFRDVSQKINALKDAVSKISDQQERKGRKDRVSYL